MAGINHPMSQLIPKTSDYYMGTDKQGTREVITDLNRQLHWSYRNTVTAKFVGGA